LNKNYYKTIESSVNRNLSCDLEAGGRLRDGRREWNCICRKFQNTLKTQESIDPPAIGVIQKGSATRFNEVRRSPQQSRNAHHNRNRNLALHGFAAHPSMKYRVSRKTVFTRPRCGGTTAEGPASHELAPRSNANHNHQCLSGGKNWRREWGSKTQNNYSTTCRASAYT
jgi:hypothetical protein